MQRDQHFRGGGGLEKELTGGAVLKGPAGDGEQAQVGGRVFRGREQHEDDLNRVVRGGVGDAGLGYAQGDLRLA